MKKKFGLWEDGKRILWFEQEQVTSINNSLQDYRDFFRNPESASVVEKRERFMPPEEFKPRSDEVRRKVEQIRKSTNAKYGPGMQ
jgi:hypothetical protein